MPALPAPSRDRTADVLCVGGGVIGLSLARELSGRGLRVAVVDRGRLGREASWAGAGIVSPPPHVAAADLPKLAPLQRLRWLSCRRYPQWSEELLADTGIEVGYRRCGGVEVVAGDCDSHLAALHALHVRAQALADPAVREPTLRPPAGTGAVWLPDLCQVRNPRLLRGLIADLRRRGVALHENDGVREVLPAGAEHRVRTDRGACWTVAHVAVCAGAWSGALLAGASDVPDPPVEPVHGEMLLLDGRGLPQRPQRVIEQGKRYLVPRDDGPILVGSTESRRGFDRSVLPANAASLRRWAESLVPTLRHAPTVGHWSGLRPATPGGLPLLTALDRPGLWAATGHFRQGLQLAPGTAVVLADWITGRDGLVSPTDFAAGSVDAGVAVLAN